MTVIGLYTADQAGAPMKAAGTVTVTPGLGIAGDRYQLRTGHWSDPRWPDQEITLIEAETADALGLDASELRRNVVTRGVDLSQLLGANVEIGGALLRFVRPCDPCTYLEELLDRPGLRQSLEGRGGIRAAVIRGGAISVNDDLRVQSPPR